MAHRFPNVLIYFVFSTRKRQTLIPAELQPKLWKYFVGIGKNHHIGSSGRRYCEPCPLADQPSSDVTFARAVQVLKANSSQWIGEHGIEFAWQEGYGAFSVSASNKEAVVNYIQHQPEHHAKHSFEDEYISLLAKSGVVFKREEALD